MKAGSGVSSIFSGGLSGLVLDPSLTGQLAAWDRAKESEADQIGIMYMARAGYDPNAAIKVMEKMAEMSPGGGGVTPWNSTHPSSQERLDALHSYLPEAMEAFEKAKEMQF